MTFLIPETPLPVQKAQGADQPFPTTWEGLGAAVESSWLRTDANMRSLMTETNIRTDRVRSVAETLGWDQTFALLAENGMAVDPAAPNSRLLIYDPHAQEILFNRARETPDAFPFDLTDEGMTAEANAILQKEYQNAQLTLDMLGPTEGAVSGFVGEVVGAVADLRNIPFAVVGGVGGSFLKVVGTEAMMNVAGEAVTLPGQFDMAQRLNIPDPNIPEQLAYAAVGGAVIGGTVDALGRAITYFRGTRAPVPNATRDPVSQSILTDVAEESIVTTPNPFERVFPEVQADPPPPPLPPLIPGDATPVRPVEPAGTAVEAPSNPAEVPSAPVAAVEPPPAPSAPSDPAEAPSAIPEPPAAIQGGVAAADAEISSAIASLRQEAPGASPLIQYMRTSHTVSAARRRADPNAMPGPDLRVRPDGAVGQALKAQDITPRRYPGLFSKTGRSDFDNLVAADWEERFPGIIEATGSRNRVDGYLDPQGFTDLLIRAANGDYSWLYSRQQISQLERQQADLERLAEQGPTTAVDDFMTGQKAPQGFYVDLEQYQFQPSKRGVEHDIGMDFDRWVADRGLTLYPFERNEIVAELAKRGGDAEFLVERALERNMDWIEDGTSQSAARNAPEPGADSIGDTWPEPPETRGGPPGAALDAPPSGAIERTAAGDQILAPGIQPVTERERLEARQRAKLVGMAKPADEGLFDLGAREQMDWLDQPSGPKAEPVLRQREADLRDAIARGENPTVQMPDGRTLTVQSILDDLDQGDIASARLDLCGKGPA